MMNAWGWTRLAGPDFGTAGEILECPSHLSLLAATSCTATRETLSRLLEPQGHRLDVVVSAEQAMRRLEKRPPDLVLLDEPLFSEDGFELPLRLKQAMGAERWIPVLLLAESAPEPGLCVNKGIDDWLPKPVQMEALLPRLNLVAKGLALQHRLLEMHRFQTLFDHVLEGIVATDGRGIVESFNPAAERIFGYRADEVVGRNVSMLMPLPDAHRHDAYMARYQTTGEATVMGRGRDIFGKRKDGTLVPISVALTEMEWLGRRHFVAVIEDISERKRQEQRLSHALAELERYRERVEEERRVTRNLVEKMTARGRPQEPLLSWTVIPAETFSGDIILAQRSPDGRLYVFAADAMGHGLPAAVSLLPVAGIFHAMAAKGLDLCLIADEMNRRLIEVMPSGHFIAACLLVLDETQRTLELWTAGMPRPLLAFSKAPPRFVGQPQLALGVAPGRVGVGCSQQFTWTEPGFLVIYSDGLTEAGNVHARALGEESLLHTIRECAPADPFPAILARLHQHLGEQPPEDDILVAVVRLP